MNTRERPDPDTVKLNAIIYGPAKNGKTSAACALKSEGRVLLANWGLPDETRYVRSARNDPEQRIIEPDVPAYQADTSGKAIPHVQNLCHEIMVEAADNAYTQHPVFRTVVNDPIGELYRRLVIEFSNNARHPTQDQRFSATGYMEMYLRFLAELPKLHSVLVCHELQAAGGDQGNTIFLPNTGSQTGSKEGIGLRLKGLMNVLAYVRLKRFEDGTVRPWAQLFSGYGIEAGDRFGGCLGDERAADLGEWLQVIRAYEKSAPAGESQPAAQAA